MCGLTTPLHCVVLLLTPLFAITTHTTLWYYYYLDMWVEPFSYYRIDDICHVGCPHALGLVYFHHYHYQSSNPVPSLHVVLFEYQMCGLAFYTDRVM